MATHVGVLSPNAFLLPLQESSLSIFREAETWLTRGLSRHLPSDTAWPNACDDGEDVSFGHHRTWWSSVNGC